MATPFKNLLGHSEVECLARALERSSRGKFPKAQFTRDARSGLETLELKARAEHLAAALEGHLPRDFDRAARWIEGALAPPPPHDSDRTSEPTDEAVAGWAVWPLGEFVARRGIAAPERALAVLHALTQRFTAEWAIRPFLEEHTERTLATLTSWTRDPSAHVRRLVSEGTRPRLPWGRRLQAFVADPTPTLPLLAALQDDPSPYVRRSVANHLNDIAKDHPDVLVAWLQEHLPSANAARRALLRHASRTAIKAGDRRVLAAFGLGSPFRGEARLEVSPRRIRLGDSVELEVELATRARAPQRLAIDYVVHHVRANGATSPKVFKGWVRELAGGSVLRLRRRHAVRPITTRTYYPGLHRVELQVNGRAVAEATFELG